MPQISMPQMPMPQPASSQKRKQRKPGERLLKQMHKINIKENEKTKEKKKNAKLDKDDMKRITKSFSKIMKDLN